jgi:phosphomannomutase
MITETVKAVLMQSGIDVYDLGIAPTPVAFRESRKYGAGIIVTSSHNPIEWNGLKMIIDGKGVNEKHLQTIINEQNPSKSKIGAEYKIESDYIDDAVKIIGSVSDNPKVTVDIGGGAAKSFSPQLLEKVGCDVNTINDDLVNSSRGPDPTTDQLEKLVSNTKDRDIGFAFDLDADRLVTVIDGKKMIPDVTLGLGIVKALELGYKNFVLSQDTSASIEKHIKQKGGTVFYSKVGEANVVEKMLSTKSQAGGEGSSGGFILSDFNYCRDGILTSGLIASIMTKDSFRDMLDLMENYHLIRDKIECDSKYHDGLMKILYNKMKEKYANLQTLDGSLKKINSRYLTPPPPNHIYANLQTLDGLKMVIGKDSWVLIRKSNTENIIRLSAESDSLEKVRNIHLEIKDLMKQSYEQIK